MPIFKKNPDKFDFFGPNLPKKGFWGWNFKNLSPNMELALPKYHVYQFSDKAGNFEFFSLNFGKLRSYLPYFVSNNVEGVALSWAEAEMN